MYMGAVLQHLVGAKLSLILPESGMRHHGFSVSDDVSGRSGDFLIDEAVIHVTTAPGEALLRKCAGNLDAGLRPIIITLYSRLPAAEAMAEDMGIGGRIDVLEIEQFLAANIYEWSQFKTTDRKITVDRLVAQYNDNVDSCETDPSLKISVA